MAGQIICLPDEPTLARPSRPRFLLRLVRLAGFAAVVAGALGDLLLRVRPAAGPTGLKVRAAWLSRWSRRALRVLGIHIQVSGTPPRGGLLVANHLSYVDILALSAVHPSLFVAKSEIRDWPLFGLLARLAGTLFVRRDLPGDVSRLNAELISAVETGAVVVVFPEGTSTDGRSVLPFHSSLLAPAAAKGWEVTPAWIGYDLAEGSVEDEVCYWRDMVFLPHFLNLLAKPRIEAKLRFGRTVPAGPDRKLLARELHYDVIALGGLHRTEFRAAAP
jgi:1-acyl-sn-glycerol-3-phosphate acyltransferase